MNGAAAVMCARHRRTPTRLSCVECGTPICPQCAIRTPVGLKCPDHATKPAAPRRSRFWAVVVPVTLVSMVGIFVVARRVGTGQPVAAPCPTETAPDVGIGAAGGGAHWKEMARSGICGRFHPAVAWTGKEVLVWGGFNCAGFECPSTDAPTLGDGAAYNPTSDTWRLVARGPLIPRADPVTAWTGKELLVWGGLARDGPVADGAAYDPARDRWRPIPASPLTARALAASAWTGQELVVWGGSDVGDGGAYNPATDTWRTLPPAPVGGRSGSASAWTGRELVVWGGMRVIASEELTDGAAYDPAANNWRRLAAGPLAGRGNPASVWTGQELVIWGGDSPTDIAFLADGAAYNPATDRWRPLPPAPVAARTGMAVVWSGKEMLVWGGFGLANPFGPPGPVSPFDQLVDPGGPFGPLGDGAAYNPATGTWRTLERVQLVARGFPITAWDGQRMIVWGGVVAVAAPASAADGAVYTP